MSDRFLSANRNLTVMDQLVTAETRKPRVWWGLVFLYQLLKRGPRDSCPFFAGRGVRELVSRALTKARVGAVQPSVRVFLYDEHATVRVGLRRVIEDET